MVFWILLGLITTGAACIIYEVVLMKELAIILGATELSASLTLTAFMFGLAFGSRYLGKLCDKFKPIHIFILIEIGIALCAIYLIPATRSISIIDNWYLEVIAAIFILLPPTILMGGEIPAASKILLEINPDKVGENIGAVYSADTIGGILGAISAGFLMIPNLGAFLSVLLAGILNVISCIFILIAAKKRKIWVYELNLGVIMPALTIAVILIAALTINFEVLDKKLIELLYKEVLLYTEHTKYQRIDIVESPRYGRGLFLNGRLQITELDDPFYHEALIHPALNSHPTPKRVIIIGGGDGGALEEVVKHNVTTVVLIELDARVIEVSKQFLPKISNGSFEHKNLKIIIKDGRQFLKHSKEKYDVIFADLPDPENTPTATLYTKEFFTLVYEHLNNTGIFVTQATSPVETPKAFTCIYKTLKEVFPIVIPYYTYTPNFGMWGFVYASKLYRPNLTDTVLKEKIMRKKLDLAVYNAEIHNAYFKIPNFMKENLKKPIPVLTDDKLIITQYME